MNFPKLIKHIFFFFLAFLFGVQSTYAKTELILPQNQISFSIEKSQNFKSLEKEVKPNIGFLKEKVKFVTVQHNSAVKLYNFSKEYLHYLAEAGGDLVYHSNFIDHLKDVAGFTQKRAVTGGHNLDNFNNYLNSNSIQINRLSTTNGTVDGISELTYQIKKADGSGGWKTTQFKKTHYNPAKISDSEMITYGKEAMAEGIQSNRTVIQPGSNTIIKGESSNGIKFLGYQNPTTGEILNFHPVLNY